MVVSSVPRILLNNGATIPQVGFGTFQIPPENTQRAVEEAIELGYRHIDTAAAYYNEAGVGAAIRASGIPRDDFFITTKLRNCDQGREQARRAFDYSLSLLGLDYLDLYLIHWPVPSAGLYLETWQELEKIREEGTSISIGVSNFLPDHLENLLTHTDWEPQVNQIEVHPTFAQSDLQSLCRAAGIRVEAYSPLGQGKDLASPVIAQIAREQAITPAQVILRWHLQQGRVIIPKSTSSARMAENLALFDFELSEAQLLAIDELDSLTGRVGGDPAVFAFPQTAEDAAARFEK